MYQPISENDEKIKLIAPFKDFPLYYKSDFAQGPSFRISFIARRSQVKKFGAYFLQCTIDTLGSELDMIRAIFKPSFFRIHDDFIFLINGS